MRKMSETDWSFYFRAEAAISQYRSPYRAYNTSTFSKGKIPMVYGGPSFPTEHK